MAVTAYRADLDLKKNTAYHFDIFSECEPCVIQYQHNASEEILGMIKRILVGLGGTPFTAVATRCATELGDTLLELIHSTEIPLFLSQ